MAEKQVSAQVRGRKILAVRYGAGWRNVSAAAHVK